MLEATCATPIWLCAGCSNLLVRWHGLQAELPRKLQEMGEISQMIAGSPSAMKARSGGGGEENEVFTMTGEDCKMLDGWKEVASFLERIWGVSVSPDSAYRYSRLKRGPLPVRRIRLPDGKRDRVAAELPKVERWARQVIRST
jgi:hypothetical protein